MLPLQVIVKCQMRTCIYSSLVISMGYFIGGALSVFAKASKAKPANKVFVPPPIPKGYQPFVNIKETYDVKKDEPSVGNLTSDTRGKLLGEQQLQKTPKSVFDMMSVEDRERIASTTKTLQTNSAVVKNYSQQCGNVRAVGFRPFPKDEAKQARYESFLESRTSEIRPNTSNEQRFVCFLVRIISDFHVRFLVRFVVERFAWNRNACDL